MKNRLNNCTIRKFSFKVVGILCLHLLSTLLPAQTSSLPTILDALGKHYEVFFSYDFDKLASEKIDFQIDEKETVLEAIDRLKSMTGLTYDRFEEKYYVIYKKAPPRKRLTVAKQKIKALLTSVLIDGKEDVPISDAFIFIRNTSISTISDLSGRFQIEPGGFTRGELVITHLNYQTLTLSLADYSSLPNLIRLSPKNLAFAEVEVNAKRAKSKNRKKWMKQFTEAFFGDGNNRKGMELLNPEVVWFQETDGVLLAEAVDYLAIENTALGYKLRFYLEEFRLEVDDKIDYTGKVYFEDLLASTKPRKQAKIKRRRQKTFQRSKKYFFRSLLSGNLDVEQFPFGEALLDDNRNLLYFEPLTLDSLPIKRGAVQDTLLIDNFFAFTNKNMVDTWGYNGRYYRPSSLNTYATCFLHAENGQIIIDHSGELMNAKEIIEVGYWTTRRLANLMPMEYNFVRPVFQEKSSDDLVGHLANTLNSLPQEKVYVHLNKPFYSLTESIWFKAYLCNAHTHTSNTLSKVVYVDLVAPDGQITKSWTLHKDKVMEGDFRFNNQNKAGKYMLRAYTQYMQNSAPEYFFRKSFWVYDYSLDAIEKESVDSLVGGSESAESQHVIDLLFFPEGGELVNGLSSNIAFKVTDNLGQPIAIVGVIVDETEKKIAEFKTHHEGLGLINLIPKASEQYKIQIEYNGNKNEFLLPEALPKGMVMRVNNRNSEKLFIDLNTTDSELIDGAFLVGHVRGQIFCFVEDLDPAIPIVFAKKSLPAGLAHFTLFDHKNRPVAERLVYNEVGTDVDLLTIETDKLIYQPREKIQLNLAKLTSDTSANLSVSVTDKSVVSYSPFAANISSYLLLNSDLDLPISNVNFYLQEIDNTKRFWLDLWMMTYGWRRFTWQDIAENKKNPLTYLPETGFSLKGYTTEKKNKDNRLPTQVMLNSLDENFIYATQETDEAGNFYFQNLPYLDSISFIIQGRIQNKKNALTEDAETLKMEGERMIDFHFEQLEKPEIQLTTNQKNNKLSLQKLERYLSYEKQSNLLDSIYNTIWNIDFDQEVVVKAKRKKPFKFGNVFDLNQMDWVYPHKAGTFLVSYLYPRYNFEIDFQNGKMYFVRGREKRAVSISINGMGADREGSNPARFLSLTADMIDYLSFNPVCACMFITARTIPRSLQIKLESGVLNVDHPGYLAAREFYAPDYATNLPIHQEPDLRTAIHWAPNIQLTKDKPTNLSFYAADTPTTYEVRVEGITENGLPVFKVIELKVE